MEERGPVVVGGGWTSAREQSAVLDVTFRRG